MKGTKLMFLFPVFLFAANIASSQTENKEMMPGVMLYTERDSLGPVYNWVEQMPQIEGGHQALREYIIQYPYPKCGLENNIQGLVVLKFIVEIDGSISETQVVRSPDECLSTAALDYFNKLSGWMPGKLKSEPVTCYFTIPINYNISEYKVRVDKKK